MDKFLKVIEGIDWDLLHEQKMEVLRAMEIEQFAEIAGHVEGLVNLIDDLQDVAAKLKIWTFPSERYDGNCPECNCRNYEFLQHDKEITEYECYDCENTFTIGE